MRPNIIQEEVGKSQPTDIESSPAQVTDFAVPTIVPSLKANGFALLPGLTDRLAKLSPLNKCDAWRALENRHIVEILHTHPDQRQHLFLNDEGQFDANTQPSVEFKNKVEKSYLTVVEGSRAICGETLLPQALRRYISDIFDFIAYTRDYLDTILPKQTLPSILKFRVFEYHASNPKTVPNAMRSHVDGSVCSLIITGSDGLLDYYHQGQWRIAARADRLPFALLIPGIAAIHDLGVLPTPHKVRSGPARRVSVTVFLTPQFSPDRNEAERELSKWRLIKNWM